MGREDRTATGGIARVEAAIGAHHTAVEADLRRVYRVDLRDLRRPRGGTSRLTHRLLQVYLDGLPGESLYKTAVRDALTPQQLAELAAQPRDGHGPWSRSDMRLAAIEDQLRVLVYLYTAANSKEGAKVAKPEPVDRPGVTKTGNVRALNADGATYLAKLRASRGATERPMTLIG